MMLLPKYRRAHLGLVALAFCAGALAVPGAAQNTTSVPPASASLSEDRRVSIKQLPGNIVADERDIWLFPVKLAHAEHWWPTIGVLAATAGLVASDAHTSPSFRNTDNFRQFNDAFSSTNSAALIGGIPAAIYAVGLWHKDSFAQETALLAGEALADGLLLDFAFKAVTARRQPLSYSGNGPYTDSFFNGSHNPLHSGGFYSGHAVMATAVATVIAHRYRHHRWVPYVAYGLAATISLSRITTNTHFAADAVFAGATGFVIARYAVLPPR